MERVRTIDTSDLTDRSYAQLKELILSRRFRPNEKLSIDQLAGQLGTSRTPVKDALHRLVADGLVFISRRSGTFVTPLSAKDIHETFALRMLFELYAAEEGFTRVSAEGTARMRNLVATMAACIDGEHYLSSEMERFLEADYALHRTIVESAQNDRLTAMYGALNVHVHIARACYVRELANVQQSQAEHAAIAAAYATNDLAALQRTLRSHITTVRDLVLETVEAAGGVL